MDYDGACSRCKYVQAATLFFSLVLFVHRAVVQRGIVKRTGAGALQRTESTLFGVL